jgi:hypothetical protein
MMVKLKGFSQEVDLESGPEDVKNILVFEVGNSELRLPVPKETVAALMEAIYADPNREKVATSDFTPEADSDEQEEESLEGAEEFGGDYEEQEMAEEDETAFSTPASEEDVPSL